MRALEFFLLRDATRVSRGLAEDARRAAADALDACVRAAAHADSLWATGSRPEAYRYATEALEKALDAAQRLGLDQPRPEHLDEWLGAAWAKRLASARDGLRLTPPETADALADHHGDLYGEMMACARHLTRRLEDRTRAPEVLASSRRKRTLAGLGVIAIFAAFALYEVNFDPAPFEVEASAYRTADVVEAWPPENAADHAEMSYWHLPPGETGWIDLHLTPPRDVSALRILNAHDVHADDQNRYDRRRFDHASRQIHVHAYSGGREVADVEHELPRLRALDRETVPLEARNVDRIRVEVQTFYGVGGGLAEIEVLP